MDQKRRLEIHKLELVSAPKLSLDEYEFAHRLAAINKELEFLEGLTGVDKMKPPLRRMRAFLLGAKIVQDILESSKSSKLQEKK